MTAQPSSTKFILINLPAGEQLNTLEFSNKSPESEMTREYLESDKDLDARKGPPEIMNAPEPGEEAQRQTFEAAAEVIEQPVRYVHHLNKGGLDDILQTQSLRLNEGNYHGAGLETVNAHIGDFATLSEQMRWTDSTAAHHDPEAVYIEFTTDIPVPYHPSVARWTRSSDDGVAKTGHLPIKILGVYDGSGNPLDHPLNPARRTEDSQD
jgi:hypothetical protein